MQLMVSQGGDADSILDNRSVPELTGAAVYGTPGYISDLTVEGIITAFPLETICQGFFSHNAQIVFFLIKSVYQSDSCFQLF